MSIFSKIRQIGPQDTPSKIIGGFIIFMLVGIVTSSVVLLIPEVRQEVTKRVPFISSLIGDERAAVFTNYDDYADEFIGFGVSTTKNENYNAANNYQATGVVRELYVEPGEAFYLYWDAPTFSIDNEKNKGKVPWTIYSGKVPDGKWWVGCYGRVQGFHVKSDGWQFTQGIMKPSPGGNPDFEWSGRKDEDGNYTLGQAVSWESKPKSVTNPAGGYPFTLGDANPEKPRYSTWNFEMRCTQFDNQGGTVTGNLLNIVDKVTVHVTPDGQKPEPEPEVTLTPLSGSEITGLLESPDTILSRLQPRGGCGGVSFTWDSYIKNYNPDETSFEVVVSNDEDFGHRRPSPASKVSIGNEVHVEFIDSFWAGAKTTETKIGWTSSNFAGDAMPLPETNNKAGLSLDEIFGIGVQSGSKHVKGTFYWKVLTIVNGKPASGWVDGPSVKVTCSTAGEDPNSSASSFKPSLDPGPIAPTPENYKGIVNLHYIITGCETEKTLVQLRWGVDHKRPWGYKIGYKLQVSTDKKFSSFGVPEIGGSNLANAVWSTGLGSSTALKGDVDPFTEGVQNKPIKGKTYHWRVGLTYGILSGGNPVYGSKIEFPIADGPSFTVCGESDTGVVDPPDPFEDEKLSGELIIGGGDLTKEEANWILENIVLIRWIINYFGGK